MQAREVIISTGLLSTALVAEGGWRWQRWQERTRARVAIVAEVLALKKMPKNGAIY